VNIVTFTVYSSLPYKCILDSNTIEKSASSLSHVSETLQSSPSHDSGRQNQQRRKRPLALAVGFKYAEDMNGRPVVITPGNRRFPINLKHVSSRSQGPSRSPTASPGQPERSPTRIPWDSSPPLVNCSTIHHRPGIASSVQPTIDL
jgi:hypothetical protein